MSVIIDQLLPKLDFFTVSMVLITSYTAFVWKKKTKRFLMWLKGLLLLFEEKLCIWLCRFQIFTVYKTIYFVFFFCQCSQFTWVILAAAFPLVLP